MNTGTKADGNTFSKSFRSMILPRSSDNVDCVVRDSECARVCTYNGWA